MQQNTGIPVRTGVSRAYRYGSEVRYVPVHSGVFGSLYGNCRSSVNVTVWRQSDKMVEEDYTVVENVRGKADVWRWFGLKKRKTDGHIEQNIALCFDCGVSVKLAGGTSSLQTHISRHHPLKQAVRSKSVDQLVFLLFHTNFILPCSRTEHFTVLICLVYKRLFFFSFFCFSFYLVP